MIRKKKKSKDTQQVAIADCLKRVKSLSKDALNKIEKLEALEESKLKDENLEEAKIK